MEERDELEVAGVLVHQVGEREVYGGYSRVSRCLTEGDLKILEQSPGRA
jgi:hypothetical protein